MRAILPMLVTLAVALPAVASASKIEVTTDPAGATVQLDGEAMGTSPITLTKVKRGIHLLKVTKEGWAPREDSIDVDGDSDFQIHAPLNPAPRIVETPKPPPPPPPPPLEPKKDPAPLPPPVAQPAPQPLPRVEAREQLPIPVSELPIAWGTQKRSLVLVVETVPADAFVQVVGMAEVKRAPATFTGFSPGTVTLQVRAPGYKEKKVEVDLTQDARTRVSLEALK